jgi:hypothetical protein
LQKIRGRRYGVEVRYSVEIQARCNNNNKKNDEKALGLLELHAWRAVERAQ